MRKLAIVTTHPIQYNAPLFSLLARRQRIRIKVFYTWGQAKGSVYDPGFGKSREWDIPLLEGYEHTFVHNTAKDPGSHHFFGIKNPGLVKEMENWHPHAVLVFGWSFYSHLACMRHFKNKLPVFFRGDSTLLDEGHRLKALLRRTALKWVYNFIDIAFYVGEANKAYFLKHGLKEDQLIRAPHAVDGQRFETISTKEREECKNWRLSLGISEDDWVVLFVGKLEEKKNPQFIIELAERLKKDRIKFLLVGDGPLETILKNRAENLPVIFLSFQNQSKMPCVYRLGNVLILPSRGPGETWGLAANEAMHAGLPVLLSNRVGGASDLLGQVDCGLVFGVGELDRVEAYIRQMAKDTEKYAAAKRNVREQVKSFSLDAIAIAIENTLLKKVSKEHAPG